MFLRHIVILCKKISKYFDSNLHILYNKPKLIIFQFSDTVKLVKNYMIPFTKQIKNNLKKSPGNNF